MLFGCNLATGLWAVLIAGLVCTALSLGGCSDDGGGSSANTNDGLIVYCAAGMKVPFEQIKTRYDEEMDGAVQVQYGGSGTLLSSIRIAKTGDLFLAADESYIETARELGLVVESIPLAKLVPIIAVAKGNPKSIKSVKDLLRDDVKVALANPDAAAIGRITRDALQTTGQWNAIKKDARVLKPTVNDVANDVRIGSVDVGIIWDATANQYDEIEIVNDPALNVHSMEITIGVMSTAKIPTAALHFARYTAAADRGLEHFTNTGFQAVEGDPWDEHPRVIIYSGAMLRPGLDETRKQFEQREGATLEVVYNGCGVLVSQMRAGAQPDAYVSCDVSFMDMVEDRFAASSLLTENDMVILVKKGNPKKIGGLADMARPGIRVGLAHPEKSALGKLAADMLAKADLLEAITANQLLDSPTGDFLVNQIRAGSLDAVIVYRSNAMANPDNLASHLDLVEIQGVDATALQPFAVAKGAKHKQLLKRFFERVLDADSRERFESYGFRWKAEAP